MKKFLSTLSSTLQRGARGGLLFFALLATTTLWAHDFSVNGIYYSFLDGNNVAVTYRGKYCDSYSNEYSGEVIIPETVTYNGTTYSVTSIGWAAFYSCALTSITIPNSVTSIGGGAFYDTGIYDDESKWESDVLYIDNCLIVAKTSISGAYTIKENTRLIADDAFYDCSSLTSITIPNSVTSIGESAFAGCSSLSSITIPNSVTNIGEYAFSSCSSLTAITIPNSVTSIGNHAFDNTGIYNDESNWENDVLYIDNCLIEARRSISGAYAIKENTRLIADYAFDHCSSLTSITIPNSVTSIGSSAFSSCSSLTSITIPNSVKSIGSSAFSSCSSLKSITIGNGVTSIGEGAFSSCSSLTSVTIPNSVTSIGGGAFEGCSSLTSATIGESVTSIGGRAFYDCSSLTSVTIPNSVTSIGSAAFSGCSALTSVTIPNSIKSIGSSAFSSCSSLTSITIPNSVKSIGSSAFRDCSSLTSITWNAENCSDFSNYSNAPFYYINSQITEFVFGDEVQHIPDYLCYGMKKLTSVSIPNSVTSIGEWAFSFCPSITSVTIGNSVTSIGDDAFYKCTSLTSITIPNSVTSIGEGAFEGCSSLTSATIGESVTSIGEGAFYDCSSLTSVTIPNSVTSIGSAAFSGCSALTSATIGESVTSIGGAAFKGCSSLTSITIPNSVTSIGNSIFYNCSFLDSVTIGESVTSIGEGTFGNCMRLSSIIWNAEKCSDLSGDKYFNPLCGLPITEFVFGDKVQHIPAYLGLGMGHLTSITIPNSVTSIGEGAFVGCSSLTSATIGESVTSIGDDAFSGCSSLTSVTWNVENYSDFSNCSNAPFYDIRSQITEFVFGDEVQHIPDYLCFGMKKLTSVTIPESVTSIGNAAFEGCSSLTKTNYTGDIASWCDIKFGWKANPISYSNNLYINNQEIKDLVIPNSVDSIHNYAFCNCSSLISVTIPESITSIGADAFDGCSSLTKTNYTGDIASWCDIKFGNLSANPMTYSHNFYINDQEIKDLVIPNTVDSINNFAFCNCSGLTSVAISESVTSIGDAAFEGCFSLTSVAIGNGVTSIGGWAFSSCSSLTSITIPNSVTEIRNSAFEGCSSLTSIAIGKSVTSIGDKAFYDCRDLTSMTIGESVTNIGDEAFYKCYSLTSLTVGESVTNIGDEAFYKCYSLTSLTVGESVTNIGQDAFYGCSKIDSIVWNAKNCADVSSLLFNDCRSQIKSFTFGEAVEHIPEYLCSGMEKITSITIPNSVTSIGRYAFNGCAQLENLTLGTAMENIGSYAFAGCNRLYHIYCYPTYPPAVYQSSFANYNVYLHVPCDYKEGYDLDIVWGNFKYIECMGAESEPINPDTVIVIPGTNDVTITWPTEENAYHYIIEIKKDGVVFCTLTFNADGQLLNIAFAPSRNGQHNAPAAAQTANGFAFTVTGLDEGANYTYDLLIQDRSGNTLQSYSGEFRTQSTNDRTVTVEYNATQGQVTGAGTYLVGDTVTLTAIPNDGYRFVRWSNEVEDNPYTFVISDNVTLSAEFEAVIPSSLENTNSQSPMSNCQKIIRDGQLLILRDGKTYNVMGAEIQ